MTKFIVLGAPYCPDEKRNFLQGNEPQEEYCDIYSFNVFDIANGKRCQNIPAPTGDYLYACQFGARFLNNKILACGGNPCRK